MRPEVFLAIAVTAGLWTWWIAARRYRVSQRDYTPPRRKLIWTALLIAAAAAALAGSVFIRPYWVAKYRGEGAELRGAYLVVAPLGGQT